MFEVRSLPNRNTSSSQSPLPLFKDALAGPPQEEGTEHSLHENLDYADEIVAVADVTEFMRKNRLPLLRRQALEDAFGQ